jgi:hypothetical protein
MRLRHRFSSLDRALESSLEHFAPNLEAAVIRRIDFSPRVNTHFDVCSESAHVRKVDPIGRKFSDFAEVMSVNDKQLSEDLQRLREGLSQVKEKIRPLEKLEPLEKRVDDLEKKWSKLLIGGSIIAACMAAFLGFTYTDIPNQARKALKDSSVKEAERQAIASASSAKQDAQQIASLKKEVEKDTESIQKLAVVGVANGKRLRVFSGSSQGATAWEEYKEGGKTLAISALIDTSVTGFTKTPTYFVSLGGGAGLYNLDGASSINSPTEKGFRIYLRSGLGGESGALHNAQTYGYYVNWIAVGE